MRIVTATATLLLLAATPAAAEDVIATPSPVATAAEGVQVPDFKVKSWAVVDASSGDVLAGQNFHEQRPMASTIKTLTSLALLPRLQYDSVYEAKPNETLTEGAHVGVLSGNKYTVRELFHGMLMRSGNDAAVALADAYGYQRTIDAMNAEAARVGAKDTVAMSPNGLDREGQVTTAADLAQIYRVAIQDERLQDVLTAKEYPFPGRPPIKPTAERGSYTIFNNDSLLNSDYPGFLGGKAGFTSQAGRTYVAGAEQNGRRLVVALLGIGGGTTQTAREVLDWSFANVGSLSPIEQLPAVQEAPALQAEPAGANADPTDLAPMPLDEATAAQVAITTQAAQAASLQARSAAADLPTPETVAAKAVSVSQNAAQYAQTSLQSAAATVAQEAVAAAALATQSAPDVLDPLTVAQEAVAATDLAAQAAGLAPAAAITGTGIGASVAVTVPVQAAQPVPATEPEPQGRGFFASLLVGLFKALLWLLLFLAIAVVALRIRAVRRQKARRAERERARQQGEEGIDLRDSTRDRNSARTL